MEAVVVRADGEDHGRLGLGDEMKSTKVMKKRGSPGGLSVAT
jgi:hypothetical protein